MNMFYAYMVFYFLNERDVSKAKPLIELQVLKKFLVNNSGEAEVSIGIFEHFKVKKVHTVEL